MIKEEENLLRETKQRFFKLFSIQIHFFELKKPTNKRNKELLKEIKSGEISQQYTNLIQHIESFKTATAAVCGSVVGGETVEQSFISLQTKF